MKKFVLLFLILIMLKDGFSQTNLFDSAKVTTSVIGIGKKEMSFFKATAKIFPNPTHNKAEIELKGFESGAIQVQIFGASGQKLRDDKRLLFTGNENLTVMFALPPSTYFIVLKQNKQLVRLKLLVQ
jgi:Secretion system C-terminal sorting domain